jgi:hypothetical protein
MSKHVDLSRAYDQPVFYCAWDLTAQQLSDKRNGSKHRKSGPARNSKGQFVGTSQKLVAA